jgi:hypothetical protein
MYVAAGCGERLHLSVLIVAAHESGGSVCSGPGFLDK